MPNQLPRITFEEGIADITQTGPAAIYIRVGNPLSNYLFTAIDAHDNSVERDVVWTPHDENVLGTTEVTLSINGIPGFTQLLSVTVLDVEEYGGGGICKRAQGPNIHVPGLFAKFDRGNMSYAQEILQDSALPIILGSGTDGLIYDESSGELTNRGGTTIDPARAGNYPMFYTLEHEGSTVEVQYTTEVLHDDDYRGEHEQEIILEGSTKLENGLLCKTLYVGDDVPTWTGKLSDGRDLSEEGVRLKQVFGGVDTNRPGHYFTSHLMTFDGKYINSSCQDSLIVVIPIPNPGTPGFEFEDGVVDEEGIIHVCIDARGDVARLDWTAWDDEGTDAAARIDFQLNGVDTAELGTHNFFVEQGISGTMTTKVRYFCTLHVGIASCRDSVVTTGGSTTEGGGEVDPQADCKDRDYDNTLIANKDYYGQFDWPSPISLACEEVDAGEEPGVDVPATCWWLTPYELAFHDKQHVDADIIKKQQMYIMQVMTSIMNERTNNSPAFTDMLNRMHATPRVYGGDLMGRGFRELVPNDLPAWWSVLSTILVRAADPVERPQVTSNTDFPTVLDGAPAEIISMLTSYFSHL